jgi:hypothetical protein
VKRKVIVATDYRQFVAWGIENKLSPNQVIWANRPEVLMGLELEEDDIVRIGVPENAAEIEEMLRTRIRRLTSTQATKGNK